MVECGKCDSRRQTSKGADVTANGKDRDLGLNKRKEWNGGAWEAFPVPCAGCFQANCRTLSRPEHAGALQKHCRPTSSGVTYNIPPACKAQHRIRVCIRGRGVKVGPGSRLAGTTCRLASAHPSRRHLSTQQVKLCSPERAFNPCAARGEEKKDSLKWITDKHSDRLQCSPRRRKQEANHIWWRRSQTDRARRRAVCWRHVTRLQDTCKRKRRLGKEKISGAVPELQQRDGWTRHHTVKE